MARFSSHTFFQKCKNVTIKVSQGLISLLNLHKKILSFSHNAAVKEQRIAPVVAKIWPQSTWRKCLRGQVLPQRPTLRMCVLARKYISNQTLYLYCSCCCCCLTASNWFPIPLTSSKNFQLLANTHRVYGNRGELFSLCNSPCWLRVSAFDFANLISH